MNKSADAFRTIGEVAEELDVPKHVLRFWEGKFPQIKPMKRGGGRRYYRPEDMELLRGIRHLLHAEGYTIKGVQKILREQGIDQVKTMSLAAIEAAAARGSSKKGSRHKVAAVPASAQIDRAADEPVAQAKPAVLKVREGVQAGKPSAPDAAKSAVLKSVIRELEACRSLLKGATEPVAPAAAKQVRAGGRT
jgi:DNA-binding transcriptional MerR regulator